jgi:hypothetical protein
MQVIAKTAGSGLLIQATEEEIKEIVNAINGTKPEKIEIGQKIPAIDYAGTISKIKSLKGHYDFRQMTEYSVKVAETVAKFKEIVENAANLEI